MKEEAEGVVCVRACMCACVCARARPKKIAQSMLRIEHMRMLVWLQRHFPKICSTENERKKGKDGREEKTKGKQRKS